MAELHAGNCRLILPKLKASSFDAIVTDPPYEYNFMGEKWDKTGVAFKFGTWADVFRVAKPGAHLLAFGGPRTYHRLVCAIEDGGWDIKDCLMWIYGTGFPKSLDVSKAIDKEAGADREVIGKSARNIAKGEAATSNLYAQDPWTKSNGRMGEFITAPATEAAQQWSGFGTALKPAHEDIIIAMKPLQASEERDTIDGNLVQLEARLWSLLPVKAAGESSGLSPREHAAVCDSAQWSADERSSTQAALFGLMDTSQYVSALTSCLNIVQSWRVILADLSGAMNTFTTEMVSGTTTDLKTLRSLLSRTTPLCIIRAVTQADGLTLDALPVARAFDAVSVKLNATQTLSALGSATGSGPISSNTDSKKPAWEPIVLARKPLNGTVAGNVLKHGTGVLNIDACRTEGVVPQVTQGVTRWAADGQAIYGAGRGVGRVPQESNPHPSGRWPANLIFTHHPDCTDKCVDGCPVRALDEQAGERKPGRFSNSTRRGLGYMGAKSEAKGSGTTPIGDSGGASRYYATFSWEADDFIPFLYCPKASKQDRGSGNTHATVKPNQLMRWLCRLITPPGGLILDPFMGSGSTGKAAIQEGFRFVGIDDDPDNIPIAEGRIAAAVPGV